MATDLEGGDTVAANIASQATDDAKQRAGALNLMRNCLSVEAGDSVLIIGEEGQSAYFDMAVCDIVADAAREIGARPRIMIAPQIDGPNNIPAGIAEAMGNSDHTLFFARFGDRVRFLQLPGKGTKTMCYTRDAGYLGAEFGRVPYGLYVDVLDRLMARISVATGCRIRCPLGTDLTAELALSNGENGGEDTVAADFTVRLFPVMIFPPLSCAHMSGRLALGRWLVSTAVNAYEESLFTIAGDVFAILDRGRITGFEGAASEVARIEAHFHMVASLVGGDPFAINSWHTGIYPKTYYPGEATDDVEHWADIVYGSPRYTHFHACGGDPGDICLSLFDATIWFDDEVLWDAGRFAFLEREDMQALKAGYGGAQEAYDMRWDIGI
ncbi:MAG: hypothetical protein VCD33_15420 [Alphaproteobacteria bacterium]